MFPDLKYLNYFTAIIEFKKCASTISLEETTESHFRMRPNPLTANCITGLFAFMEFVLFFPGFFFFERCFNLKSCFHENAIFVFYIPLSERQ